MSTPQLVEFYSALPEDALRNAAELPTNRIEGPGEAGRGAAARPAGGKARKRAAVHVFRKQVEERYTEGTLLRLLVVGNATARRAAVLALGLLGSCAANDALAQALHDEDDEVARLAGESMWSLWFRGDCSAASDELHRLARLRDANQALAGLTVLLERAPRFAEAYNQRAIVLFRLGQYDRAVADCEAVLRLTPQHFGAQAGLGQCYLRLRRHKAALRAFRVALGINPRLAGVAETVRALEQMLGDDGR